MKITKIHPLVWIFHEEIKEPKKIIDFYENNFVWEDWYTFGKMLHIRNVKEETFLTIPTEEEWNNRYNYKELDKEESLILKEITDKFYNATYVFIKENNIELENPSFFPFSIAKYIASPSARMNFHTDYQQEKYKIPGDRMYITAVFYLNDNYEGGEISFLELDENQKILWNETYKPKSGDILVFSSKHPIYHGVKTVETNNKYILRTYWYIKEAPTKDWIEGISEYGEETWREMKEEEAKKIRVQMLQKEFNNETMDIQYVKVKNNE